jgi:hypothetical protein
MSDKVKETKNEAFVRIAEKRINKILDEFRVITNLFAPSYKTTSEQRNEVVTALRKGVEEVEYVAAGSKVNKEAFKFKPTPLEE